MEVRGGAEVPPLTARGSGSPSCRACSSESQERSGGQEVESCRGGGEEEEDEGVPPVTLG